MAEIVVQGAPGEAPRKLPISEIATVFGRAGEVDIVGLCARDSLLSREHFLIRRRARRWWIMDLDSKNGTRLNDAFLSPDREEPLAGGDRIRAGGTIMVFEAGARPPEGRETSTDAGSEQQRPPAARAAPAPPPAAPRGNGRRGDAPTRTEQQLLDLEALPSRAMRDIVAGLSTVAAASTAPVLLTGESGTGKNLCARFIHARSARAAGPFIAVNCASVPASLFESVVLGHERGAFTDAKVKRRGFFELASGGTLFLDEIGELDAALQPKLLRVLEEGVVRRLGDESEVEVDVRVVAATNRDLHAEVAACRFREDLFFRLDVLGFHLPPLRERTDDIPILARLLLDELRRGAKGRVYALSDPAVVRLCEHPFPGNVRELQNTLRRASLLARGIEIGAGDIERSLRSPSRRAESDERGDVGAHPPSPRGRSGGLPAASAAPPGEGRPPAPDARPARDRASWPSLVENEREHIARTLAACGWVRAQACKLLGTTKKTLARKIREYGIEPPERRDGP